jgi:hypothetical protein
MEEASAVGLDAKFAGYSAGIFRISAEEDRGNYTAGIAALSRRTFSISNCGSSFGVKRYFFYIRFFSIR